MKTTKRIALLSLLVVCCLVFLGCSKKDGNGGAGPTNAGTDQSNSASKAKTDVEQMDVNQLRAAALKCKADAEAKSAETEKVAQELIKALGAGNADKREELSAQMESLRKSEEALNEQLNVYIEKLKEKGGDVSGLSL
ncbi:MAG: hypothetical protein JXN61_04835 [Sedimentisphaerales bacterium]|nr:hypothetical protein [Sedimentisphaerales bacterium]